MCPNLILRLCEFKFVREFKFVLFMTKLPFWSLNKDVEKV
jgi:hypothetical protein